MKKQTYYVLLLWIGIVHHARTPLFPFRRRVPIKYFIAIQNSASAQPSQQLVLHQLEKSIAAFLKYVVPNPFHIYITRSFKSPGGHSQPGLMISNTYAFLTILK